MSAAELCHKHNVSPATFQDWNDKLMEGEKHTLEIRQEFIWKHTPEQNGHIESFHGTLKWGYAWLREFVRFQDTEVMQARVFADCNDYKAYSNQGHAPNKFACKARDGDE